MQKSRSTRAWIASLFLCPGFLLAQSSPPPECKGQPLSLEAQVASMPSMCDGMSPACERISKSTNDVVFVGTVTKVTEGPAIMLLDGACTETTAQTVTLVVKESFSDSLPQIVTVRAGYINGHWFKPKDTALVFARKLPEGTIFVSGCQTEPIGSWFPQAREDLAYLRSRDKLPPTGSLLGYTEAVLPQELSDKAPAFGFRGQSLTIEGPVSSKVTTSKAGAFRLDNLPPGKYTVHLNSSLPVYPALSQQIDIPPRGCAEVRFYIESEAEYKRVVSSFKVGAKK